MRLRLPAITPVAIIGFCLFEVPPVASLLAIARYPQRESSSMVTVGPANADIIGCDNTAIQNAIDRIAAAGGGTVLVKSEPTRSRTPFAW